MGFYSCCVTTIFYIFAPFPGEGITNPTAYLRHNCLFVPWVSIIILIVLDWSRACPISGHRRTWKRRGFFFLPSDYQLWEWLRGKNLPGQYKYTCFTQTHSSSRALFAWTGSQSHSRDPHCTMLWQRRWQCPSNNPIEMPLGTAIANHFSPSSISWSLTSL